jgi:hypothetical protein
VGFSNTLSKLFFDRVVESNTEVYRAENYLAVFDWKIEYQKMQQENRCV